MNNTQYAERKSRVFFQRAARRTPDWRAVGSVTIISPDLDRPLILDGVGFTIFFQEAKETGELRNAIVLLNRWNSSNAWSRVGWFLLGVMLGGALLRNWYHWYYF